MKKQFIHLSLLVSFLFGCGDINDGQWFKDGPIDRKFASADCDINTENFEYFTEKIIKNDINCAFNQVNLLLDLVKPENPNIDDKNISKQSLMKFLNENVEDSEDLVKALDIFFQMNSFFFNRPENYLVKGDLSVLKELVNLSNKELVNISELSDFNNISLGDYRKNNEELISKSIKNISNKIISILTTYQSSRKLSLLELSENLKLLSGEEIQNKVLSSLAFKDLLFSGDEKFLLKNELKNFLMNSDKLVGSVLSLANREKIKFKSKFQEYSFYKEILVEFDQSLLISDDKVKFDFDDIPPLLEAFRNEIFGPNNKFMIDDYEHEVKRAKEIFTGSNSEKFYSADIRKVLDEVYALADRFIDFSHIYLKNEDYLNNFNSKITDIKDLVDPVNNENFSVFVNILKKQRYYQNDVGIGYYGNAYKRNIDGINLFGAFYHGLEKVVKFYEKNHSCELKVHELMNYETSKIEKITMPGEYVCADGEDNKSTLHLSQLYLAILDFKKILYESKIIDPTREEHAAENANNLPDLFLETANGNGALEIAELSEFFNNLLSAIPMKDSLLDFFTDRCGTVGNDTSKKLIEFPTACVRENLYDSLVEVVERKNKNITYIENLPRFKKYFDELGAGSVNQEKYFLLLEKYSRGCGPFVNIPTTGIDLVGIYTGLINMESTMSKFDLNGNNIIDSDEAELTYAHFERALKTILKWYEKLAGTKNIFKFLLKYKRLPTAKDIGRLLTIGKMPSADRETIVTILISLQTVSDQEREKRMGDRFVSKGDFCKAKWNVQELNDRRYKCLVEADEEYCN